MRVGTGGSGPKNTRFRKVIEKNFTQRRKDRKDAKAGQMLQARLCVFAIFASLRELSSLTCDFSLLLRHALGGTVSRQS